MSWKSVGKVIKKFAPILGAVIPGGSAVSGVISMVANTLNVDNPTPENILGALTADPEARQKLLQLQMDHKLELEKIVLASDQAFLADKQNARNRELEIVKATGERDWFLPAFTILITSGFFGLLLMLTFTSIPAANMQMINIMLGTLGTVFVGCSTYYFGSSKGSAQKTNLIGKNQS